MPTELVLRVVTDETRPVLERLWQLYRHDLSEFRGQHLSTGFRGTLPDEDGMFTVRSLLPFAGDDPDRASYLFWSGPSPVGFALVSGVAAGPRLMSEFFVVRGLRGHGIGTMAIRELFALHPGTWEIPFQEANIAAARFWRRITAATGSDGDLFEERRPVPGKPQVPHDVWITVTVAE
jgi:predicted acetyltransferase